ncbi:MAG: hypothetical protein JSS74_03545 [Actinobacteria bacterium]|nr:hypothetical protein [Actinomycetota bacterium]
MSTADPSAGETPATDAVEPATTDTTTDPNLAPADAETTPDAQPESNGIFFT